MSICKVTLDDILASREERAERQRQLTTGYGMPLVCVTMNIAGEVKNSPLIEYAFMRAVQLIRALPFALVHESIYISPTGPVGYFVYSEDAAQLKAAAVAIEQEQAAHRMFDIDVTDAGGEKLSREIPRACVVCGVPGRECARSRAHGLGAVKEAQRKLLWDIAANGLAQAAADALMTELTATPKPGLVDSDNNGAHTDMDMGTFIASIEAIKPFFEGFARSGLMAGECGAELAKTLQRDGISAERKMLAATHGANTHRGAVYSMGLLTAAMGVRLVSGEDVYCTASSLASLIPPGEGASNGARVREKYGAAGAAGEAQSGFITARRAAAQYSRYRERFDRATSAVLILPHIMAHLEDTNLLHRGGTEGLNYVRAEAKRICALPECERRDALAAMDKECIRRGLSPGGSADMLALAVFIGDQPDCMGLA